MEIKCVSKREEEAMLKLLDIVISLTDDEDIINEEVFNVELRKSLLDLRTARRMYFEQQERKQYDESTDLVQFILCNVEDGVTHEELWPLIEEQNFSRDEFHRLANLNVCLDLMPKETQQKCWDKLGEDA
jgi:hypothetical protein